MALYGIKRIQSALHIHITSVKVANWKLSPSEENREKDKPLSRKQKVDMRRGKAQTDFEHQLAEGMKIIMQTALSTSGARSLPGSLEGR